MHECGHQFWYGLVGNNEFEHAWIDEGLNTFSTARVIEEAYSPNFLSNAILRRVRAVGVPRHPDVARDRRRSDGGLSSGGHEPTRSRRRRGATAPAPAAPSRTTRPRSGCTRSSGTSAGGGSSAGMSLFFTRVDVQAPDAGGFLQRDQRRRRPRSHLVFRSGVPLVERVRLRRCGDADRRKKRGDAYHTEVTVQRRGEGGCFPVDLFVMFADGSRVREHWDGRERWKLYTWDRPAAAVSGRSRSRPRAAARHRSHEQQPHARAADGARPHASGPRAGSSGCRIWCRRMRSSSEYGARTSGGAGRRVLLAPRDRSSASRWRRRSPALPPRSLCTTPSAPNSAAA